MAGRDKMAAAGQWKDVVAGQAMEIWVEGMAGTGSRSGDGGDGATPGKRGPKAKDSRSQGSWQPCLVKRVEGNGTRMKLYVTYRNVDGRETTEAISQKDAARLREADGGADGKDEGDREGQGKSGRKSRKSKDDATGIPAGGERTFEQGMRVRVLFDEGDGTGGNWYFGTVDTVDIDQNKMEIEFDDGDKDSWPVQDPGWEVQIIVPAEELAETVKSALGQVFTVALTSYMKSSQLLSGKMPKNFSDALNSVYATCAKTVRSSKAAANTEEAAAELLTTQARTKLVEDSKLLTTAQWAEFALCLAGSDRRFQTGGKSGAAARGGSKGKTPGKAGGEKARQKEEEESYDLTSAGSLCEVEWEKEWWLASVVEEGKGKVRVLYAGSEDEFQWVPLDPQKIRRPQDDEYVPILGQEGEEVHCRMAQPEGRWRWVAGTVVRVEKGAVWVAFEGRLGLKDERFGMVVEKVRRPKPEDEDGADGGGGGEVMEVEVPVEPGDEGRGGEAEGGGGGSGKRGRGRPARKDKEGKKKGKEEGGADGGGSSSKGRRGKKSVGGEEEVGKGREKAAGEGEEGGEEQGKEGDKEEGGRAGEGKRAMEVEEEGPRGGIKEERAEAEGVPAERREWVKGLLGGAVHEVDVRRQHGGQGKRWGVGTVLAVDEAGERVRVQEEEAAEAVWAPVVGEDGKMAVRPTAHVTAEGVGLEQRAAEGYKGEVLVLLGGCWLRGSVLGAATGKGSKKANKDKEGVKVVVSDREGAQQKRPLPSAPGCLRSPLSAAPAPAVGESVQVLLPSGDDGSSVWTDATVQKVDVAGSRVLAAAGGSEVWVEGHWVRRAGEGQVGVFGEMAVEEAEGGGDEEKMEAEEAKEKEGKEGEGKEGEAKEEAGEHGEAGGKEEGVQLGKRKREDAGGGEANAAMEAQAPTVRYEAELRELQQAYNEGKESAKEDVEQLLAEVKACHLRFHRASIGCTVAGRYRRNGVRCTSCRARIPGKGVMDEWRVQFTQCAKCGVQYERKRHCPVCNKVFVEVQDQMLQCAQCSMWVHGPCDGLDEISLAAYAAAGKEGYLCPQHRRKGERGASVGELRFIPIVESTGLRRDLQVEGVFGLRLAGDGRVLYGLRYAGAKELEWRGGVGGDAAVQRMVLALVAGCLPAGAVLHPGMADAKGIARRWGELVKASGGPRATLKIGASGLQDLGNLYVEEVQGIRKMPPEACKGEPGASSDVYVQMVRGGLGIWGRLPLRNAALLELTAAFLFSAAGVASLFLPAAPREALLRDMRLWDAFCEGMGLGPSDPAASVRPPAEALPPAAARPSLKQGAAASATSTPSRNE